MVKSILLYEDDISVIFKFISILNDINHAYHMDECDVMYNITVDSACNGTYNLSKFDLIFVDRDNNYLPGWSFLPYIPFDKGSATRIYPFSWDQKNNLEIINLVDDRFGVDVSKNVFCKSIIWEFDRLTSFLKSFSW